MRACLASSIHLQMLKICRPGPDVYMGNSSGQWYRPVLALSLGPPVLDLQLLLGSQLLCADLALGAV